MGNTILLRILVSLDLITEGIHENIQFILKVSFWIRIKMYSI